MWVWASRGNGKGRGDRGRDATMAAFWATPWRARVRDRSGKKKKTYTHVVPVLSSAQLGSSLSGVIYISTRRTASLHFPHLLNETSRMYRR